MFLSPTSYRFDLYTAAGALVRTQDNIAAVPQTAGNVDVPWTAGVAFNAGDLAYLSDGSGALTAGLAYKADSGNAYSCTTPEIAMAISAVAQGAVGSFRKAGQMTGLNGMTAGAAQYVGAAGAVTSAAPSLARRVGQAVSVTVLDLSADPPASSSGFDYVQLQSFG